MDDLLKTPAIQYGFASFSLLLLGFIVFLVKMHAAERKELVESLGKSITNYQDHLEKNTQVMAKLCVLIDERLPRK